MESIKSRSNENNAYSFEENWSSEKKNNDVNEDLKYNEYYNAYETNHKEDSEQWLSEIDFISNKFEDNLKIEEPNNQPSKMKRKHRDFSIKKKDLQKEKIRE